MPGAVPGLVTAVRAVDDAPGIHVDIESDDTDAEAARLVALGASRSGGGWSAGSCGVPGGQVVCVLPVESGPELFEARATTWP